MANVRWSVDHARMSERRLHVIEDDLAETWLEGWAADGVDEIESYLAKHLAFLSFLESREPAA